MSRREITVGTAQALLGERSDGVIQVARLFDGSAVTIPVIVIRGSKPGRCIWIQSGVHGNEYVGTAAIHQLLPALRPERMAGSAVLVPMANILAFRAGTRTASQDGLDMNRVWPGKSLVSARSLNAHTEVVVHHLHEALTQVADVVVDCHTGGWPNRMASWVAYVDRKDEAAAESNQLAEATGFDVIWHRSPAFASRNVAGSLSELLSQRGIPSLVLEAGGEGRPDPESVAMMTQGLRNILKASGILPGEPKISRPALSVVRGHWLRASEGGMVRLSASLLDEVHAGTLIGTITDLYGEQLEEILSPVPGVIIGLRTLAVVNSGDYIGNVAQPI